MEMLTTNQHVPRGNLRAIPPAPSNPVASKTLPARSVAALAFVPQTRIGNLVKPQVHEIERQEERHQGHDGG